MNEKLLLYNFSVGYISNQNNRSFHPFQITCLHFRGIYKENISKGFFHHKFVLKIKTIATISTTLTNNSNLIRNYPYTSSYYRDGFN